MGDYRKLEVWRRARLLVMRVYQVTRRFPTSERYGLTAQLRRASVSILANVAEGAGRNRDGELGRFLSIARGSAYELECEVTLAGDLGFMTLDESRELLSEADVICRMLSRLAWRITDTVPRPRRPGARSS